MALFGKVLPKEIPGLVMINNLKHKSMVSVKVVSKSTGRPVKAYKVSIGFSGFFRGFSSTAYTNSEGEVHFENDPGEGTIYVNGSSVYKGHISGMKVIYV
jgi:hypothetical protein